MSRTNTSPDQIGEDCLTSSPLWDLQTVGASFDRDCEHSHCSSVVLRPHKPVWVVWQPWFYLRLKGLWLCWVVRGGIWCPMRLSETRSLPRRGYSPSNPRTQRMTRRCTTPIDRLSRALKLLVISVPQHRSPPLAP